MSDMTPGQRRHERMVSRLRTVARCYEEAWFAGRIAPALAVAEHFGMVRTTARTEINRARLAGLLDAQPEHRARIVPWGEDRWLACARCRTVWPCNTALARAAALELDGLLNLGAPSTSPEPGPAAQLEGHPS